MNKRLIEILDRLSEHYASAKIALNFETPFQLLVAVILSAQCTDVRVNLVTPHLFAKYPDVDAMAAASIDDVKEIIHSTGFYNNKAKNIIAAAQLIKSEFNGKLPNTMEEILRLPGVARKTANVVLAEAYGVVDGIVVDTHVMRISKRLGFVSKKLGDKKNAVLIERELMSRIDKKYWRMLPHYFIFHGRQVCRARKPDCRKCPVVDLCKSKDRNV